MKDEATLLPAAAASKDVSKEEISSLDTELLLLRTIGCKQQQQHSPVQLKNEPEQRPCPFK